MKVIIKKEDLIELISKAERLATKNSNLPVLSFIKMSFSQDTLEVISTNLDLGFSGKIKIKNQEDGELKESILISGDLLSQFINNLPKNDTEITLEKKENNLIIKSSRNQSKIILQKDDDYPSLPEIKTSKEVIVSKDLFLEGIKNVWYSSSNSAIKPELSSVFIFHELGELIFVATDSFRLAEKRIKMAKIEEFEGVLIPYKNAIEIVRIFENTDEDLKIYFDENQIKIEQKDIFVISRVVDGNFPDYKQIIPKNYESRVHVLKQEFFQNIKLANIFVDQFNQITIETNSKNEEMFIYSKNSDRGDSENSIKIKNEGPDQKINLNSKYINDCINSIEDEQITIDFNGNNKPIIIKNSKNNDYIYLVMPMNR